MQALRDRTNSWIARLTMPMSRRSDATRKIAEPAAPSALPIDRKADLLRVARKHFLSKGFRDAKMHEIALAAGISKRTLYLWHASKADLFRACIAQGGLEFPVLAPEDGANVQEALTRFALALASRLSEPAHLQMGRLLLKDQHEFADFMPEARRIHALHLIEPLARWLRRNGLEMEGKTGRTRLFVAMVLAFVHEALLLGADDPGQEEKEQQIELAVNIFMRGAHTR